MVTNYQKTGGFKQPAFIPSQLVKQKPEIEVPAGPRSLQGSGARPSCLFSVWVPSTPRLAAASPQSLPLSPRGFSSVSVHLNDLG